MIEWLVYQTLIVSEEQTMRNIQIQQNIMLQVAIRKVKAETKDEAIGKFYADTQKIEFSKRVEPIVAFKLDELKQI